MSPKQPVKGGKRQRCEQSVVPEIANKRQYARMDDEKIQMKLKFLPYNFQRMSAKNQVNRNLKNHLKSCTQDVRNTLMKQVFIDCINLSSGSLDVTEKMFNQLFYSEPMVSLDLEQFKKSVPAIVKKRKLEKKEITKMKNKKHFFPLLKHLFGPENLYADEGMLNIHDDCTSVKLTSGNTSSNKNKGSSLSKRSTPLESMDTYNNTADLLSDLQDDPEDRHEDESESHTLQINKQEHIQHDHSKLYKKKQISSSISSEQAKNTLTNVKKSKSQSTYENKRSTSLESKDPDNNTSDLQDDPEDRHEHKSKPHTLQINKQEQVRRDHNKLSKKERSSTSTTVKSSSEQATNTLANVKKSKSPEVFVVNKNKHCNDKTKPNENETRVFSRVITSVVNLKKRHSQTDVVNNNIHSFNLKREVKEEKCEASKIPSICLTRTQGNTYTIKPLTAHTTLCSKAENNIGKNVSYPDSGISVSDDGSLQEHIYPQDMEKLNEMEVVVNSNLVLKNEALIDILASLLQEEDVLYSYECLPHGGGAKTSSTTSKSNIVCESIAKLIDEFNGKKYNMIYLSSCLIRIFHKIIQDQDIKFQIIRDRFKMFCRAIAKFVKSINKPFAKRWLKDKYYINFLEICDYIILDEKSMISQLRYQEEKFKMAHYINPAFKYFENASVGCYDIDVSSINVVLESSSPSDEDSSYTEDIKPSLPVISVRPEFGIHNFAVENHNVLSSVVHLYPLVNSAQSVDNDQQATTTYENKRSSQSKRSTSLESKDPDNNTSDLQDDPEDRREDEGEPHTLQINKQEQVQRDHSKLYKKKQISSNISSEQAKNTLTKVKKSKSQSPEVSRVNSAQPVDNKQEATVIYGSRCMEFAICKKLSEWTCMCQKATYCSEKCQTNHWPIHKNECRLFRTPITT